MKTVEIDFLSDDASVRQNSAKWLKEENARQEKRERMKKLVSDLSTKTMAASAGR
jgi:hypothetical protein